MRKTILLAIALLSFSFIRTSAQIIFRFGPPPMTTAEENLADMNKLLKKSYKLPIFYKGDSIPDTILLHEVYLLNYEETSYVVRYKDDTTEVAIAIEKESSGYKLTRYYDTRVIKRSSEYNKTFLPDGDWKEYHKKGRIKLSGAYKNGMKNCWWKHYDMDGNMILKEKYKDNVLLSSKAYLPNLNK